MAAGSRTAYFADGAVAVGDRGLPALLLPALAARTGSRSCARAPKQPRGTDLALYHVGNDPRRTGGSSRPRAHPGVAVLHEWVLHHLIAGLTLGRKDVAQYLAALERDHGIAGRLLGLGVVDGCVPPLWETRPEDFPLAGVVLDATRGRGVIVHSHYVEERVREWGYGGPVWRILHPAWPEPEVDPVDLGDGPVIGCLGHLNASKRIPQLLEAFARVHAAAPRRGCSSSAPPRRSSTCRAGSRGWASLRGDRARGVRRGARFWSLMAAADVVVRCGRRRWARRPAARSAPSRSAGRSSSRTWAGSRSPGRGCAEGAGRRARDGRARGDARAAPRADDLRAAMSAAAREHVAREHDLDHVADLYAAALEEAAGRRRPRVGARRVAAAAADVGIEAGSEEAAVIAARLREARVGD